MILEVANLKIKQEEMSNFETAFPKAAQIISSIPGYISHELQRCVETKGRYVLLVRWASIEAHKVNFQQSPKFQEWRALMGGFNAERPAAEHFERVTESRI